MSGKVEGLTSGRISAVVVVTLAVAGCVQAAVEGDPPRGEDPPGVESAVSQAVALADATAPEAHGHHAPEASGKLAAPSGHSLYHSTTEWTDQGGSSLTLAELSGRPQVVAMVYTHCSFACPRIMADMKRIEGRILEEGAPDVGFVLVSIDPERDTPERLADFAESTRLDPGRWTLLTGSPDAVLELAVLLGVKYRATGEGEFAHSNLITVLSPEGEIRTRIEGLGADVEPAVRTILELGE